MLLAFVCIPIGCSLGSACSLTDAETRNQPSPLPSELKSWRWWLRVALYSVFILAGETVSTLLQRFYYDQGGNSKWMFMIATSGGFPLLLLILLLNSSSTTNTHPLKDLVPYYTALGLISAFVILMISYGIRYLPISTYTLVSATQLAFNAIFSYILNSQKFTAFTFNSVILVTLSTTLLAVGSDSQNVNSVSKGKFALGFILTVIGSAAFSLNLSLTQLVFQKILKKETFIIVIQMFMCTSSVATVAAVIGLFASGDWRGLHREMKGFEKGEVCYVTTLVCIAIFWQVTGIGMIGLTFVVSSLFSNVVCTVGLPLVSVSAVIFFHDKMDGVKAVAMLIAIWGFLSYIYQDYLDYIRAKNGKRSKSMCSEMSEVLA